MRNNPIYFGFLINRGLVWIIFECRPINKRICLSFEPIFGTFFVFFIRSLIFFSSFFFPSFEIKWKQRKRKTIGEGSRFIALCSSDGLRWFDFASKNKFNVVLLFSIDGYSSTITIVCALVCMCRLSGEIFAGYAS